MPQTCIGCVHRSALHLDRLHTTPFHVVLPRCLHFGRISLNLAGSCWVEERATPDFSERISTEETIYRGGHRVPLSPARLDRHPEHHGSTTGHASRPACSAEI